MLLQCPLELPPPSSQLGNESVGLKLTPPLRTRRAVLLQLRMDGQDSLVDGEPTARKGSRGVLGGESERARRPNQGMAAAGLGLRERDDGGRRALRLVLRLFAL